MQNMEKIYEQYFETVNKYLFCLTHNSDISEELTQETFYRAVIRNEWLLDEYNFDKGIKETIKWYLENRMWWENILSGDYKNYYERQYGDI